MEMISLPLCAPANKNRTILGGSDMAARWITPGRQPYRRGAARAATPCWILPLVMAAAMLSGCGGGGAGGGSRSAFCGTITGLPSGQSVSVGVQTSDAGSNDATVSVDGSFVINLSDPLTIVSTWFVY